MNEAEFKRYTQTAFAAVSEAYGLRLLPPSPEPYVNRFAVRFANSTTLVIVEGINYGFGVNIRLASTRGRDMKFKTYDFDDLLTIRAPEFQRIKPGPDDTSEIQKRQIDAYADALPRYADDVLRGDFTVFPQLARAIEERKERYAAEMPELAPPNLRAPARKPWWKFW